MPSTLEVDKITSTSGTSYLDAGTLDNMTLGSSVEFPSGHVIQMQTYLITGPITINDGIGARSDALICAFTKQKDASTSKLIFNCSGEVFGANTGSVSYTCNLYTKVDTTYTIAPVSQTHGSVPVGTGYTAMYRLNDATSTIRLQNNIQMGPFTTTDYGAGTYSFVQNHYRDGYGIVTLTRMSMQITEVII